MAIEKTVILNVETKEATKNVDLLSRSFEDAYGEIQPLTGRMGELEDQLYELANAGKQGTSEFKTLAAEVGRMKKTIQQTDAQVDGLAMTTSQRLGGALGGVTSGFELVQGAMGAMGAESENVQKALLKVQSAMAIAQGVQGIRESIPAFKAMGTAITESATAQKILNFVMKQNPIMLIVSAVAALVAAYALLSGSEDTELDKQKAINEEKKTAAFHQRALAKDIKESSKYIAEESVQFISLITKLKQTNSNSKERRDLIREINGEYGTHLKNLKNEAAFQAQLSLVVKDYIQYQTVKFKLMKNEAYMQYNLEKQITAQKEINRLEKEKESIRAGTNLDKTNSTETDIGIAKAKQDLQDSTKAIDDLANRAVKLQSSQEKLTEGGKKYVEQQKEVVKVDKQVVETKKEKALTEDEIYALEIAQLATIEDEKTKIKDEAEKERLQNEANNLEATSALRIQIINKQIEDDKIAAAKKLEIEQKLNDAKLQAVQNGLSAIGNLAELFAGKSKASQKKAFQVQKAVNIAGATIDTFKAATSAFSSMSGIPIVGPALGGVAAAAAIAAGLVNIKKISSTQFEGGSATGGAGVGGSVPSVPQVQSANFNVVGAGGANQLAQLSSNPIKAYVVSGEVSSAQSMDRNIVKNATI